MASRMDDEQKGSIGNATVQLPFVLEKTVIRCIVFCSVDNGQRAIRFHWKATVQLLFVYEKHIFSLHLVGHAARFKKNMTINKTSDLSMVYYMIRYMQTPSQAYLT